MIALASPPPRVAIACPGVGHVFRGFETFARALFEHVRGRVPAMLFKGAGEDAEGERRIRCFRRTSLLGRALGRVLRPRRAIELEAITFAIGLDRALRRGAFDVALLTDYRVARVLLSLRRARDARPVRILFHNSAPEPPRRLGRFDLVQQVTGPAQDEAIAAGLANTRLVPMPVDATRFAPGAPEEKLGLRDEVGLPREGPLVLCAAAHEPFKRIDLLVEALASIESRGGPAPLLLVAGQDGRETARLRELARSRLGARVAFRRFAPADMPRVHRAADVFALPSRIEGFGLVLLEAMASGVPVVSHADANRRWIVGDAGALVDCDAGAEALRAALARLLGDPAERARLGERGRARALAEFAWPALLDRYVALFREAHALEPTRAAASAPAEGP